MKKIYSMALAVVGFLFSQGAMAQTQETLAQNYEVTTTLDFSTATYSSDPTITLGEKTGTKAYETGNKKQQELYYVTEPEALNGIIALQGTGSKGWAMRSSKGGLWCYNANRSAAVLGLKANQVVAFYCTQSPTKVMTLTNGDGEPDGPFTYTLDADNNAYYATMTADGQVGFCGAKSVGYISSIVIYTPKAGAEFVNYTVKYVNEEGTEIAESRTASGMAGSEAAISSTDKNPIVTAEGVKYIYDSDDSESQTVAADGTTVVTVKFHVAKQIAYVLNAVDGDGNVLKDSMTTGTSYEGETVNAAFPQYFNIDGTLYETAKQNKGYFVSLYMEGEKVEKNITYTATEITDVVFLSEGEAIEGMTPVTSANSAIRSSNGSAAYAAEADVQLTTLAAGKYKLGAVIFDANKSPNTDWHFIAGTDTVFTFNVTTVNYQAGTSEEFTVTQDNTPVYFAKAGNVNSGLDLVYIVKTGDYEAPETVANSIAELKALPSGIDVTFKATDVYVTCASSMSFTHYLQDATGGIVMDMNLTMALSSGAFELYGDSVKFSGTLACQYVNEGTPTLTISEATGEKTSLEFSKATISPKVLTVAEAKDKANTSIEQTLVMVKDAKIISVDPTDSYAVDMYLIQGTDTIGFSDPFFTQGWEFTAPATLTDVEAVAGILVNDENLGIRTIYAYTDSALVYGAGEAPVEIESLAGLKNVEYGTRVAINLKDVAITLAANLWGMENIVVAQDGEKGVYLTGSVADMLVEKGAKAGKKLEGKLYATYSQNSEDKSVSLETTPVWTDKSEISVEADTVVAPIVVTIPDVYTNEYYARYVKIENVAIPDTSYNFYFYVNDGKDSLLVYDNLSNLPEDFTFPTGNVDVEGIALSMLDMNYETGEYFTNYYVLPLSVVDAKANTDGITNVKANVAENAAIYTIGGVKVSGKNLQKGLYIINGKKVVVK